MATFVHLTAEKNVPRILRNGISRLVGNQRYGFRHSHLLVSAIVVPNPEILRDMRSLFPFHFGKTRIGWEYYLNSARPAFRR